MKHHPCHVIAFVTIAGSALAGTVRGGFYGSAAQETAGTWSASGGGNSWAGSYGAK